MGNTIFKAGAGGAPIEFSAAMLPTEGFCGMHDVPMVRLLCLECGQRVVIASVELVMLDERCMERCREIVSAITGTPKKNIWVHITHAISTPHTPGPVGPPHKRPELTETDRKKQEVYYSAIYTAFEKAAESAMARFGEADLGVGTGECHVNRNRDVETPFGWWIGLGDGPSNHKMTVLKLAWSDGSPVAYLVSYALKPCVLDNSMMREGKRQISSDVSGEACRILEQRFGVPVLFCMSAAGDQVPREMALVEHVDEEGRVEKTDLGVEKGFEIIARLGREMADAAAAVMESIECCEAQTEVNVTETSFKWPAKGRQRMVPSLKAEFVVGGETEVDIGLVRIGDIALVSTKPEINYETERQLYEASTAKTTILLSMVNGGMKYMPEMAAYERNTWEAQSSMLMPGAAEKFVETAARLINGV